MSDAVSDCGRRLPPIQSLRITFDDGTVRDFVPLWNRSSSMSWEAALSVLVDTVARSLGDGVLVYPVLEKRKP